MGTQPFAAPTTQEKERTKAMRKTGLIGALVIAASLLVLSGCDNSYGSLLEFNGGELYYTSAVSRDDANKLGEYLLSEEFFDGNKKTVQINKEGNTYEFRMVIKKGIENDPEFIAVFRRFARELSDNVFEGSPVDIHLCDERLKTLRVVIPL